VATTKENVTAMARLTETATKRAALYPRVSDRYAKDAAERGQETSLDTQEKAMRRFAAERRTPSE
jgi:hypothetical protein